MVFHYILATPVCLKVLLKFEATIFLLGTAQICDLIDL